MISPARNGSSPKRGPLETTADALLGGRVRLVQPAAGYRAAVDPVLLAAAVEPPTGARVIELGCGAGALALCLLARRPDLCLTGVEDDPAMAALARQNAEGRFELVEADALSVRLEPADTVVMNPPFHRGTGAHATHGPVGPWLDQARRLVRAKGQLGLIHRADRLPELLSGLAGFGAVVIRPIWPRAGAAAKRVLITAVKGSRAPARLEPGLVLHGPGQGFTAEASRILRDGAAWV